MGERSEVVGAAIVAQTKAQGSGDFLPAEPSDHNMKGSVVTGAEQLRWQFADAHMLRPIGRCGVEFRPSPAKLVERHPHRSARLPDRVAAPFEVASHRSVALVDPG